MKTEIFDKLGMADTAADDARELIEIMIRENARDRLEAQRAADRIATTVMTVARVLGPGSRRRRSRS